LVSGNEGSDPHYWTSKATAEVEFIIQVDNSMIPIEVKSGVNVRSKSLKIYRDKYNPDVAIRSSLLNLKQENKLLNIPLFLAFRIPDFCRTLLENG